jgi:hypothetical protein
MRTLSFVAVSLAMAVMAAQPASAEGGPDWDACVSPTSNPDQRVAACTAVIDGKTRRSSCSPI